MKSKNIIQLLFSSLVILLCLSCNNNEESLDAVKQFKPDDKYFKSSIVSLHFITETSEIERVDSVFRQMISGYNLPVDAKGCTDGEFTGESPYDAYDYKHCVTIKIKDEKIVSVSYNEIKKNGKGKREDEVYCEEMSAAGTTPAIAYPVYEKTLLDKQNYTEIDAVSGATYSLYRFRFAVMVALIKARLAKV